LNSKGNTIFWAVIACLLWSTAYAGIKLGLEFDTPFHLRYWMILLWLSFMAASAFSIWYKLLQRPGVKVSELNFWKFINPITGAVLSWLLIPGEKPEWLTIAGMFIITTSLIIYYSNTNSAIKPQFNNSQ
jgi:drug/metabolite transporter (DMT)-like permease